MGALLLLLGVWVLVAITEGAAVSVTVDVLARVWSVHPPAMTALYAGALCALLALLFSGRAAFVSLPAPVVLQTRQRPVGVRPPDDDPDAELEPTMPVFAWTPRLVEEPLAEVVSIDPAQRRWAA